MEFIKVKNLHEAVEESMKMLKDAPIIARENQNRMDYTKELQLTIDVEDVNNPTISKAMPGGMEDLVKYVLELRDGARDFELDYKEKESEKWGYTYHRLFEPYITPCIEELKRNNATRRAVLPIAGPKSYGTIDPPCLQLVMFKIVDNKLNTTVVFRSNDGVDAFAMNSFGIVELARKIANEIGLPLGRYTHVADSFHAYSNEFNSLDNYCNMFEKRGHNNCHYEYTDYLDAYEEYAEEYLNYCAERHSMLEAKKLSLKK